MKYRLSRRAIRNLEGIQVFIAKENPSAAVAVLSRLLDTFERLTVHPKLGQEGRRPGTREFVQAPYVIVYRILNVERLTIAAVLHGSQQYS